MIRLSQKMELNKISGIVWGDTENVRVCVIEYGKS